MKSLQRMCMSEIEDPKRRGKPVVKWKDSMKEYVHERNADREGRNVWIGRCRGSSAVAIPLGDVPGRNKVSDTIDIKSCFSAYFQNPIHCWNHSLTVDEVKRELLHYFLPALLLPGLGINMHQQQLGHALLPPDLPPTLFN